MPDGIINYLSAPSLTKVRGAFLVLKTIQLVLSLLWTKRTDVLIIDYHVNIFAFPFIFVSRLFDKKPKIILDVRTLPAIEKKFRRDVRLFHFSLEAARKTCDGLTFITPAMRDYCRERVDLKGKKTGIWSSGFNKDIFDPKKYVKESNRTFELFYHGSICIDRGVLSLLEAVHLLVQRGYPLALTLIGQLEDEKKLRQFISDHKLQEICFILKPVDNDKIPQMIKNCDLPVIPFRKFKAWEVSSPLKLIEYLAMGKSIVLTDIEAHRTVAGRNAFAFYSKSDKPKDLAEAIERAYRAKDVLEVLGQQARSLALREFTWEDQARRLAGFLTSLS